MSETADSVLLSLAITENANHGLVKCSFCAEAGLTSTVNVGGSEQTCIGWGSHYDEQGRQHFHDPNQRLTMFHCSNGHHFQRRWYPKCWCGWSADKRNG